jgi:hypothetical protein
MWLYGFMLWIYVGMVLVVDLCYGIVFDFYFITYLIAKPDEHPHPTRNPTGSGVGAKFHPWVRVWV